MFKRVRPFSPVLASLPIGTVATRLHADQFTQMEVFVSDVAPSPQLLPTLSTFDELATLQGSAMLHTLCLLRGIVTDVLKVPRPLAAAVDQAQSSTLVNCCTLCKGEMAEWFTVEREGTLASSAGAPPDAALQRATRSCTTALYVRACPQTHTSGGASHWRCAVHSTRFT